MCQALPRILKGAGGVAHWEDRRVHASVLLGSSGEVMCWWCVAMVKGPCPDTCP